MKHKMICVYDHEGTEEWECPICGRKYLIEWYPWKKTVLEQGDVYASHSASKGGLQISGLEITT